MAILLILCTFFDVFQKKIPNKFILLGIVCGLLIKGIDFLFPFGLVLLILFPLASFRMIGSGDIKLIAVIAGLKGLDAGSKCIISGFLIGAMISLFKILIHGGLSVRIYYFLAYFRRFIATGKKEAYYLAERDGDIYTIPFSVSLATGCLVFFIFKEG